MITYKLLTNQGERNNNEDCIGMLEKDNEFCFVLADGLGGHGYGELASETVVKNILQFFYTQGLKGDLLSAAIEYAQNELLKKQQANPEYQDMKTTLVVLHIDGTTARWAHVGDSRLYCFKKNKLITRTFDHSVPQNLVLSGEIKEKEIRHHPDRNRLLRVMGTTWEKPKYEISAPMLLKKSSQYAFLLCTDGFWELIDEKIMQKCLKQTINCDSWIGTMEQTILKNGKGTGMDNYSAIAIRINSKKD